MFTFPWYKGTKKVWHSVFSGAERGQSFIYFTYLFAECFCDLAFYMLFCSVFRKYGLKSTRMKLVHTIEELRRDLAEARAGGKKIGLVPTMGALHEGHASLVRRSVEDNGVTVVSVFLNPTQFNDKKDLERYPRTLEADCRLLEAVGADFVFAPSVEEVYPEPDTRTFSYPPVDTVMEGAFRPGHFNGV